MNRRNNKGFTLAELLIVVAVIAVLVAVAIPTFANQLEKSRQAVDVANLRGAYAAGRLAEMEGGVDNVKFESVKVKMSTGQNAPNDAGDSTKFYASYWYDPDSGKLAQMKTTGATDDVRTLDTEYATEHFKKTSQRGKAQGSSVLADTSQLPGNAGSYLTVYTSTQLEALAAGGYTTGSSEIRTGTLDRAIRVTFYKTLVGTWKLHEVRFVVNADEGLAKDGTEDTLAFTNVSDEATGKYATYTTEDTDGTISYALASHVKVNGEAFSDTKYTVTATGSTNVTITSAAGATTITGTASNDGTFTVTITSVDDPNLSGTFTVTVTKKTT